VRYWDLEPMVGVEVGWTQVVDTICFMISRKALSENCNLTFVFRSSKGSGASECASAGEASFLGIRRDDGLGGFDGPASADSIVLGVDLLDFLTAFDLLTAVFFFSVVKLSRDCDGCTLGRVVVGDKGRAGD
jgi:hypothetical protein